MRTKTEIVINKISGKWYPKYQWKCEKYVVYKSWIIFRKDKEHGNRHEKGK